MIRGRPRRRPFLHPLHQTPHNMQTNEAQNTGAEPRPSKTGFHDMNDFMVQREKQGVSGDMSPNVQVILDITALARKFDIDVPNTDKDALIYFGCVLGGTSGQGNDCTITQVAVSGTQRDILNALINGLEERPELISIFEAAARVARQHHMGEVLGHVSGMLKSSY